MINGLEGIPGSGKSYEAVVYHVLPMLQQGRRVITNLPLVVEMFAAIDPSYTELVELRRRPKPVLGVWNADAMDDDGNGNAFTLFDQHPDLSKVVHSVDRSNRSAESLSVFGHVWDYYSTWKHPETGQGPVFIIDECHLALPTIGTDKEVVEFFKLHRHFNCDILLMTQSFRDINQPIARLMAMLVRCRKADILGKKDRYIRKVHAGYRGAPISVEERPYKKQFFPLYKSHTQGNSVAESAAQDVLPLSVKLRRATWAFWVFTVVAIAWMYWPKSDQKNKVQKTSDMQWTKDLKALPPGGTLRAPEQPAQARKTSTEANTQVPTKNAPSDDPDAIPEPYASKGLHLTGRISMGGKTVHTFAVSNGGQRISTLDSRELQAMGYKWQPLTDCAGTLRWKGKAQSITCDAPTLAQGSQDRPVVIDAGASGPARSASPAAVHSVPLPEPKPEQPGQITQAELSASLRVKNPAYAGMPRSSFTQ